VVRCGDADCSYADRVSDRLWVLGYWQEEVAEKEIFRSMCGCGLEIMVLMLELVMVMCPRNVSVRGHIHTLSLLEITILFRQDCRLQV
jgi:hypothetical protein